MADTYYRMRVDHPNGVRFALAITMVVGGLGQSAEAEAGE